MSLTDIIADELYAFEASRTCCRKALLCGLLYSCRLAENTVTRVASFYRERDAKCAADIIDTNFSSGTPTEIRTASRGGHRAYAVCFSSRALSSVFADIDTGAENIASAVGFRCRECEGHFMRGVFLSCAAVSKPKSGYHLEISVYGERRAELLFRLLCDNVAPPGRIVRGERVGLYYKSNAKIADLLYFFGASRASFEMANVGIERDIRNNENRATNCVTRNISRAVGAASRHIEAINYLYESGKDGFLSEELAYTARLRLENASATLSELAMLHEPPITKSGLNGRLSKILAVAEEQKQANNEKRE